MIKSTKSEETKNIEYPILMVSNSDKIVVLFIEHRKGFAVQASDDDTYIGEYLTTWNQDGEFKPYNGKITLENSSD